MATFLSGIKGGVKLRRTGNAQANENTSTSPSFVQKLGLEKNPASGTKTTPLAGSSLSPLEQLRVKHANSLSPNRVPFNNNSPARSPSRAHNNAASSPERKQLFAGERTPVKTPVKVEEKSLVLTPEDKAKYALLLGIKNSLFVQPEPISDDYKNGVVANLEKLNMQSGITLTLLKQIKATWDKDADGKETEIKKSNKAYNFLEEYVEGIYTPQLKMICRKGQADSLSYLAPDEKKTLTELLKSTTPLDDVQIAKLSMILYPPKPIDFNNIELPALLGIKTIKPFQLTKLKALPRVQENIDFTKEQEIAISTVLQSLNPSLEITEEIKSTIKGILKFPEHEEFKAFKESIREKGCSTTVISACTQVLGNAWEGISHDADSLVNFELIKAELNYATKRKLLESINLPYKHQEEVSPVDKYVFERDSYTYTLPRNAEILDMAFSSLIESRSANKIKDPDSNIIEPLSTNILFLRDRKDTETLFIANSPLIGMNIKGRDDFPSLKKVNKSLEDIIYHLWPKPTNGTFHFQSLNENIAQALKEIFPNLQNHEAITNMVVTKYKEKFLKYEETNIKDSRDFIAEEQKELSKLEAIKEKAKTEKLDAGQSCALKKYDVTKISINENIEEYNEKIQESEKKIQHLSQDNPALFPNYSINNTITEELTTNRSAENLSKLTIEGLVSTTLICIQEQAYNQLIEDIRGLNCTQLLDKTLKLREHSKEMGTIFIETTKKVKEILNETEQMYTKSFIKRAENKDGSISKEMTQEFREKKTELSDKEKYPELYSTRFAEAKDQIDRYLDIPTGEVKLTILSEREEIAALVTRVKEKENTIENLRNQISDITTNMINDQITLEDVQPIFETCISLCQSYGNLQADYDDLSEEHKSLKFKLALKGTTKADEQNLPLENNQLNEELQSANEQYSSLLDDVNLIHAELGEVCNLETLNDFMQNIRGLNEALLEMISENSTSLDDINMIQEEMANICSTTTLSDFMERISGVKEALLEIIQSRQTEIQAIPSSPYSSMNR